MDYPRLWQLTSGIVTFQRFIETTKPCLKKHQIRFGEDLFNINVIPEVDFSHDESEMNMKSQMLLKPDQDPASPV